MNKLVRLTHMTLKNEYMHHIMRGDDAFNI
jgi:hypothetical protein